MNLDIPKKILMIVLGLTTVFVFAIVLFGFDLVTQMMNFPALLIVLGGTLVATLIGRPPHHRKRVWELITRIWRPVPAVPSLELDSYFAAAEAYRHGRVRIAESCCARIDHTILRDGVRMVLDRVPVEEMYRLLDWHITATRERDARDISIVRSMTAVAPAFGMLGTLLGLVTLLHGLDTNDMAKIGSHLAVAITSTLYGIILATLVLKPMAIRLEHTAQKRFSRLKFIREAVSLFKNQQHPQIIRETLVAFDVQFLGNIGETSLSKVA